MSVIDSDMRFTRLANWFGSDAEVRDEIAKQLAGRPMVVIPFAGGMSVLPVLDTAKIIVNDLHQHLINMARVIADPKSGQKLYRHLRRVPFHPVALRSAQVRCIEREQTGTTDLYSIGQGQRQSDEPDYEWACDYFVCTWMGRGGSSGQKNEFQGALPVRYSPNGGGSGQRFHNAVLSLPAWRRVLRRCEITCDDAFDVLDKTHDSPKVAIYCDSPWVEEGDSYRHSFTIEQHKRLARKLEKFKQSKVVVRYGDCNLIRELYPESHWRWIVRPSRNQANNAVAEVLLVNSGVAA